MKYLLSLVILVLVAGVLWPLWSRWFAAEPAQEQWVPQQVQRLSPTETLHEIGELAPRDPIVVQMPLKGRIEWLVEDGVWVEAGERLFIINEDEALEAVAELRSKEVNAQQELFLARLQREQAVVEEDQKVEAAERTYALEQIGFRILSTEPKGGETLMQLHEQLLPLEAQAASLRRTYEQALAAYQSSQDSYLDNYDAWQDKQDALLRLQARIDELRVGAGEELAPGADTSRVDEAKKDLATAEAERDTLLAALAPLRSARDQAKVQRDEKRPALDAAEQALQKAEAGMQELHIQVEIEKRGMEAAQLTLDLQLAELELTERKAALEDGKVTLQLGATSQVRVDELASAVVEQETAVAILRERLAIASRPTPAEQLTEAQKRLERAEVKARNARKDRDRALKKRDLEVAVKEADLRKVEHDISQTASNFPGVIDNRIKYLRGRLELMGQDDEDGRAKLEQQIQELERALVEAKQRPPNVVLAPKSGVVMLGEHDNRNVQTGDELELRAVVLQLKPLANMEVRLAVNEVRVRDIAVDMPVSFSVPALGKQQWSGRIASIAGAGRDKFSELGRWGSEVQAGVVQFPISVRIDDVSDQFRQGMTAVVSIATVQHDQVLCLPRAAVTIGADGLMQVRTDRQGTMTTIKGRLIGSDFVLIESGLQEGDVVYALRQGAGK